MQMLTSMKACWLLAALTLAVANDSAAAPVDQRPLETEINGQWIGNAVCYGPHRDGQGPDGPGPTREQVAEDVRIMHRHWRLLRMYGAGDEARYVLETIRREKLDMRVMVGAWIDPEAVRDPNGVITGQSDTVRAANRQQIDNAIKLANEFPELVWAVTVGNETQVEWSAHRVQPRILLDYLREVRRKVKAPVSTADDGLFWESDAAEPFRNEVDFIHTHIYAMWRGRTLDDAVAYTKAEFEKLQKRYPKHPLVLGEAGWATQVADHGEQARLIRGAAGLREQTQFVADYLAWTTRAGVINFIFEAFDEKWKGGPDPKEVEKHWGLYYSNRKPKPAAAALPNLVGVDDEWIERVGKLAWVTYFPTNANPDTGHNAPDESIREDLTLLRRAGFDGLITYGGGGGLDADFPQLAADAGFKGVIIGVWNPLSDDEVAAGIAAAKHPLVVGVCVGNEGFERRYSHADIAWAIAKVRDAVDKPVTTTEESGDYIDPRVMTLGDWVFPNAHPVYNHRLQPDAAVRWTVGAYQQLRRETERFVWFKEVGLPSDGDEAGVFTEAAQAAYYRDLAASPVVFAYFEAFDLPWKDWRAFETKWGVFTPTREPKQLARHLFEHGPRELLDVAPAKRTANDPSATPRRAPLYVYRESDETPAFTPSGRLGDLGDVTFDTQWRDRPYAGDTCIRVHLATDGAGPNDCEAGPPCRWSGLAWLHPPHNWGAEADAAGAGRDLTGYTRVTFYARADEPALVRFGVGGVDALHGDSLAYPAGRSAHLNAQWTQYTIDLTGADLSHIIKGFGVTSSWDQNPDPVTLYLDDIRFE